MLIQTMCIDGLVLHTPDNHRTVGRIYLQDDGKYWIFEPMSDLDVEWVKHFTNREAAEYYACAYYLEEMK